MLEARSLTKYYNHTPAVRQVSFTVKPGEILGYLGPNGAGKSTTVKMLTGLIEPSEGQIFYRERSVYEDFTAFQQRVGYVPEEAHFYPPLSGREYLQLMGRLRGLPRRVLEPKMDEFLRAFSLWDDRHSPLSAYSKGMRQKILLSAALLHDPDVLILDEPFSGLDVTSGLMLRTLLRALAGQGKIILYSSHVLEVVEKICSTVLILRNGEVVAYDSIERLRELMSQPSLEGVFAQLAQVDDGDELANRIVDAMDYRGGELHAGYSEVVALSQEPPLSAMESVARRAAELGKDVRYALRSLAGSPGFTAVALISLSLAICILPPPGARFRSAGQPGVLTAEPVRLRAHPDHRLEPEGEAPGVPGARPVGQPLPGVLRHADGRHRRHQEQDRAARARGQGPVRAAAGRGARHPAGSRIAGDGAQHPRGGSRLPA